MFGTRKPIAKRTSVYEQDNRWTAFVKVGTLQMPSIDKIISSVRFGLNQNLSRKSHVDVRVVAGKAIEFTFNTMEIIGALPITIFWKPETGIEGPLRLEYNLDTDGLGKQKSMSVKMNKKKFNAITQR